MSDIYWHADNPLDLGQNPVLTLLVKRPAGDKLTRNIRNTQDTCPLHDFRYYKLKFIAAILNASELKPLTNPSVLRPTKSAMYICL